MGSQKFCVGEEVGVKGLSRKYDTDRTEVINCEFSESGKRGLNGTMHPPGWFYKTAHTQSRALNYREDSLVKLPPDEENSFASMMDKLITVEA